MGIKNWVLLGHYWTLAGIDVRNFDQRFTSYSSWLLEYEKFLQHCSSCLSLLHNYFDDPTKLFSNLYLVKFF